MPSSYITKARAPPHTSSSCLRVLPPSCLNSTGLPDSAITVQSGRSDHVICEIIRPCDLGDRGPPNRCFGCSSCTKLYPVHWFFLGGGFARGFFPPSIKRGLPFRFGCFHIVLVLNDDGGLSSSFSLPGFDGAAVVGLGWWVF